MTTKNTITQEDVKRELENAEIHTTELFNKTVIVSVKLQNGFVLTESSSCVDPKNFDLEIGKEICLKRIENKLWELLGFTLQVKKYEMDQFIDEIEGLYKQVLEDEQGGNEE